MDEAGRSNYHVYSINYATSGLKNAQYCEEESTRYIFEDYKLFLITTCEHKSMRTFNFQ